MKSVTDGPQPVNADVAESAAGNVGAEVAAADQGGSLRPNSLGVFGIVFFVVAAAAPLAAITGTSPVVFIGAGGGAPGMFLAAGLVCLLFSVGYAAASRHITSAGGFAAYIARSLHPRAGVGFSFVSIASYTSSLIAVYALYGTIASGVVATVFHAHIGWQWWTFGTLAVVAGTGYVEVRVANRLLGVLLIGEVACLGILSVAVLVRGGDSGIDAQSFVPSHIFSGSPGTAFMFAFLAFLGFEATAIYGEETRVPKRTVPIATYVAVVAITAIYVLSTWAIDLGWGSQLAGPAAAKDPTDFVFTVAQRYVGTGFSDLMQVLVMLSFFATLLAIHTSIARYAFSLGRGGILPPAIGRTHPRFRSPHLASLYLSGFCLVVLAAFTLLGADPFTVTFSWLSGVAAVGIIATETVVSIGIIVFFRRTRLDRRPWHSTVAPALAALALIGAEYLALSNYKQLAGVATDWVFALPAALPVVFAGGWLLARYRERAGTDLYDGITADSASL